MSSTIKPESWWDRNVNIDVFKRWVKGVNAPSRKYVREYIFNKGYRNVLDVGAGLCEDYYGYLQLGGLVFYNAVDFTNKFVDMCTPVGIHIVNAKSDQLPFADLCMDVTYCRHLLEHLPYYESTIKEMLRTAKKEVIVTFFFPPHDKPDDIRLNNNLPHNTYNKKKIEDFVMAQERVYNVRWEKIGEDEEILFIELA